MLFLSLITLALGMAAVQSLPQQSPSLGSSTAVLLPVFSSVQRRFSAVNVASRQACLTKQRALSMICQAADPEYSDKVQQFNSVAREDNDLSLPELFIELQMVAYQYQTKMICVDRKAADRFRLVIPQLQMIIRQSAQNLAIANANWEILENGNALATLLMTVASMFSFFSSAELMPTLASAETMTENNGPALNHLAALENALYKAIQGLDQNASLQCDMPTLERQRHSPMLYALQLSLLTLYYYMLCEKESKMDDWSIAAESGATWL